MANSIRTLFITGLLASSVTLVSANDATDQSSYGSKIGNKALNGFANLATAPLEIPKNIINTTNQSNIFYGVIGGLFKGIVNTGGRIGVGVADLVTFPIPTKPIAYPVYIWDDFDVDTTYGDTFRLNKSQAAPEPVEVIAPQPAPIVVAPATPAPAPAVAPRAPGFDSQDTNKKLDSLFKKRMKK
ncbi:MAG: exosortase system-associated protein, TIGR04073 family [Methylococcales bacterium]|nr:exosortase system-associated protein, TIGR04073 family [Methylococcaceae bacterium]